MDSAFGGDICGGRECLTSKTADNSLASEPTPYIACGMAGRGVRRGGGRGRSGLLRLGRAARYRRRIRAVRRRLNRQVRDCRRARRRRVVLRVGAASLWRSGRLVNASEAIRIARRRLDLCRAFSPTSRARSLRGSDALGSRSVRRGSERSNEVAPDRAGRGGRPGRSGGRH